MQRVTGSSGVDLPTSVMLHHQLYEGEAGDEPYIYQQDIATVLTWMCAFIYYLCISRSLEFIAYYVK